jgi:PPM family protein phosphatase
MTLTLRYAVRSDLGLVRGNNEDSVYAGPRLLAIADGMGGHAAGEVASKIVIGTFEPLDDDRPTGDLTSALRAAVFEANNRIADAVEQDHDLEGMGTTLTALRFAGAQVALVHVGDSRAYLLRNDEFEQITHDDTYVQYLVDSGKLTPDEAMDHPRKSVILRALRGADVEPDIATREAHAGDRYLLCSDGLSDVVSSETIAETLRIPDVQECADRLVELALRSGGPDNVTVIVADVVDSRPGDAVDDVPVRDGAFVEPGQSPAADADSPAERAAAMSRPRRADPASPTKSRRSGRWKTPALILGILVLIAAALGGTYAWAQTQYYVGRAGDEVAIYRGVNAAFGPIKFSEVYENTDLKLDDLQSSWRDQVESGITANSKGDAEAIVDRLRHQLKPLCPPPGSTSSTPSGSPGPSTTPSTSASTSRAPSTSHSASGAKQLPKSTPRTKRAGGQGNGSSSGAGRRPANAAPAARRSGAAPASTGRARSSSGSRSGSSHASSTAASRTPTPTMTPSPTPSTPALTVSVPGLPSGSASPECR